MANCDRDSKDFRDIGKDRDSRDFRDVGKEREQRDFRDVGKEREQRDFRDIRNNDYDEGRRGFGRGLRFSNRNRDGPRDPRTNKEPRDLRAVNIILCVCLCVCFV